MNATQKSEVLVRAARVIRILLKYILDIGYFKVLNEVIGMLERVVPLMSHPSDTFLTT